MREGLSRQSADGFIAYFQSFTNTYAPTDELRRRYDAALIDEVCELTEDIMRLGGDEGSSLGTGGMKTKLHAASICMEAGCEMVILNGAEPTLLYDLFDGKRVGTLFSKKGGKA